MIMNQIFSNDDIPTPVADRIMFKLLGHIGLRPVYTPMIEHCPACKQEVNTKNLTCKYPTLHKNEND